MYLSATARDRVESVDLWQNASDGTVRQKIWVRAGISFALSFDDPAEVRWLIDALQACLAAGPGVAPDARDLVFEVVRRKGEGSHPDDEAAW